MELIAFLVVLSGMSGVLGIFLVVCQNLLVSENGKWMESFQYLAQVTGFNVVQNEDNYYLSLVGDYFGLPTKLEVLNIGSCEGVLPSIQARITICPLNQLKCLLEIKRNRFISRGQNGNPFFEEEFIITSQEDAGASKLLAPISLQKKLREAHFDQLSIKRDELCMMVNDVEVVIDDFVYCLDVLFHIVHSLDDLNLES